MKRPHVFFMVVVGLGIGYCHAAVPQKMNYQGKLTDATGNLVANGQYDMKFAIYDAETEGTQKWTETWDGSTSQVRVANGIFNVLLGTHNPITIAFDEHYWLELQVKSGSSYETLSPRQQIVSSGYAFRAESVTAGAITADSLATGAVTADKIGSNAVTADKIDVPGLDGDGYSLPRVPVVNGINPNTKAAGYSPFSATITGQNFQSFSQARIGSTNLTGEDVSSSAYMTADVPSGLSAGIHDVFVSSTDFVWGTGSGLFTVNTPIPTLTPTPTITPTPTWGQARCEEKSGYWAPKNDGGGGYGCWIKGAVATSCATACSAKSLLCDQVNFNDPDCSIIPHIPGAFACSVCTVPLSYGNVVQSTQECGAPCGGSGACRVNPAGTSQNCSATFSDTNWYLLCVCVPN